jgi:class 3 adenylate cyclase
MLYNSVRYCMSPEAAAGKPAEQSSPALEVAHVLFMDIVGYSRLPMDHQTEAIRTLQEIVGGTPEFQEAQAAEELICLPTGDGMALAFFGDALRPVVCARRICAALKKNSPFGLRMGIHSGPVYRIADINANLNVAGGGINLAQRVMDCGDAGHILLSETAADVLSQLSAWKPAIHDLGKVEVKHRVVVHIFNLFTDEFGNPNLPIRVSPPVGDLNPNPFDPWRPAVPPVFVGRSTLLAKITDAIDEGRSVSLVGDWRIGKSSLLKTCMIRLEKSGRPAKLLSGGGTEGASPSSFVEHATGRKAGDGADAAADVLASWSKQVAKPGLMPALLVDEFDALVVRFEHRFFERLRGMLDYLCVIASSRRELDRVYTDLGRTSPFQNRFELLWVGLLEDEAAEQLASRCEQLLPAGSHALVREWAGRHPFFLQLFSRKLVDSQRREESAEDAKEQFLAEGGARLRELWGSLSDKDKQTMRAAVDSPQPQARTLRRRGLLTEEGRPFGRLLVEWLKEEN